MPSNRSRTGALTPAVRNAYDHYGELLARLVRLTRELTSAPLDALTAANLHMEKTGTRFSVAAMRHLPLTDDDRADLAQHLEFFELLARFGGEYQQLRDGGSGDDGTDSRE